MDPDFVNRLRHPDLDGIRFRERVRIVRRQMAEEAEARRDRRINQVVTGLSLLALVVSVPAGWRLGTELADRRDVSTLEKRSEIRRLREVMWDVQDRIAREEQARAYLRLRINEYVHGRLGPVPFSPGRFSQAPSHWLFKQPNFPRKSFAFFEAFPTAAVGVSGACATISPTGVNGEVLTFSRASTATCMKTSAGGLVTTGIANGDLVSLSANQPRVEYDQAGTLGLLVERSRINVCLRSQEFENAVWTLNDSGGKTGVRTADFAIAPDGTMTADRLQFPATTGPAEYSRIYQSISSTGGSGTCSVFIRGNGTSGAIPILAVGGIATTTCNYVSTSWVRCSVSGTFSASDFFYIGASGTAGLVPAQDILVWGAQCEIGAYATSYIPTTSASVTRVAESANFVNATNPALGSQFSASVSYWPPPAFTDNTPLWIYNGTGLVEFSMSGSTPRAFDYRSTAAWVASPTNMTASVQGRLAAYADASNFGSCLDGACGTSPKSGAVVAGPYTLFFSEGAALFWPDGIISRVCLDPSPTRCR